MVLNKMPRYLLIYHKISIVPGREDLVRTSYLSFSTYEKSIKWNTFLLSQVLHYLEWGCGVEK